MRLTIIRKFLALESASGIILLAAAILAILVANSPLSFLHQQFVDTFLFTINEVLMAIFFLLVGLELKRGFIEGPLSHLSEILLPAIAAFGGMICPALIYIIINYNHPAALAAWSTPVATDIAFALGILSLFGKRVPISLKLFLLALAIFDDIGAIIIIAVFYSHALVLTWLVAALAFSVLLYGLNRLAVLSLKPYLLIGALLWFCLLKAGIHPTIAGVILALAIPCTEIKGQSPLHYLEDKLHPWAAYGIMPLFALANAGFSLQDISLNVLFSTVVWGITLGLFLGKQLGVMLAVWGMNLFFKAKLPRLSSWPMLYGVSILCGIGFTMSLFLGTLSFQNQSHYLAEVKLGVILGSLLSGLVGALVLSITFNSRRGQTAIKEIIP